ncbi:MAG: hypothetical protein QXF12_00065 [Candidatus Aenigmatarchaeota archaeon]
MHQERDDSLFSLNSHYRIDDVYTNNLYRDVLFAYSIDQRTPDYYFRLTNSEYGYIVRSNRVSLYTRFLVSIDCFNESVSYIVTISERKVIEFDLASYSRDWLNTPYRHWYYNNNTMYYAFTQHSYHTRFGVIVSFVNEDVVFYIMPVSSDYMINVKIYIIYTDEDFERKDLFVTGQVQDYGIINFIESKNITSFISNDFMRFYLNKLHVYAAKSLTYFPLAINFFTGNEIQNMAILGAIIYRYRDNFVDITADIDIGYVYPINVTLSDTNNGTFQLSAYNSFYGGVISDPYLMYSFHYFDSQKDYVNELTLTYIDLKNKPEYIKTYNKKNPSFDSYSNLISAISSNEFEVESYSGDFYIYPISIDYFPVSKNFSNNIIMPNILYGNSVTDFYRSRKILESNMHYSYIALE